MKAVGRRLWAVGRNACYARKAAAPRLRTARALVPTLATAYSLQPTACGTRVPTLATAYSLQPTARGARA